MSKNNREITQKAVILLALTLLAVILLYGLFSYRGTGTDMGLYFNQTTGVNGLVISLLVLTVKLLWLVFIVSLTVGLALALKKYLKADSKAAASMSTLGQEGFVCPCCGVRLNAEFKFCPNCKASLKDNCLKCRRELQVGWNCCPNCGAERDSSK